VTASLVQTSGLKKFTNVFGTTPLSITMPGAFTAGNRVIVVMSMYITGGGSIPSMTIGGSVSGTRRGLRNTGVGDDQLEMWDTTVLPSGLSAAVSIATPASPSEYFAVAVEEWSGLATGTAFDQTAGNGGTGTSMSVTSPTLSQADELVYAGWNHSSGNNIAITQPGSPWVSVFNDGDDGTNVSGAYSREIVASTAGVVATATLASSSLWDALICTWKIAGAAQQADSMFFAAGSMN
jgi:hypothetical protein